MSNDDDEYVVELDLPGIPPDLFAGMIVADVRAVTQGRGGSKPLDGMEALGTMCREHMAVVILELAQRVARLEDLYGAGG